MDGGQRSWFHFWQLVNQYLFQGELTVESKGSNQGILDAVRALKPKVGDFYYIAFDKVYDNMDVVNKLLDLKELAGRYPGQIVLLDITCFEYFIFAFHKLIEWTGNGHKDVVAMREHILAAVKDHKIDIDSITDEKTRTYLMGFKRYSTEKVIKSMTNLLTDGDEWSIKGEKLGTCWHKDCCVLARKEKRKCNLNEMTGKEKIKELLSAQEIRRAVREIV